MTHRISQRQRPILGAAGHCIVALALLLSGGIAAAQVEQIPSAPTSLVSFADRMISYRSQNHMWQTADGATHVIINRGPRRDRSSLALYSTYDGGVNWAFAGVALPDSNGSSTSDGWLADNRLQLTWDIGLGTLRYAELVYDPAGKTWTLSLTEPVLDSADVVALTPAMAVDALGRIWLAFTQKENATGNYSIRMLRRGAPGEAWVDTGFTFGPVGNEANARSGRPIATSRGMGMVFTVNAQMYWTERGNDWTLEQPWPRAPIYTKVEPTNDPYGTHFSIVADPESNMHLVSVDGGRVVYSRYLVADRQWVTRILTEDIKASYVQATLSDGNVMLFSNALTHLTVLQSRDMGDTFVHTQTLVHPPATAQERYNRPRLETPSVATSPVPVLQQYVDGRRQGALFFAVPVVSDPVASGGALR